MMSDWLHLLLKATPAERLEAIAALKQCRDELKQGWKLTPGTTKPRPMWACINCGHREFAEPQTTCPACGGEFEHQGDIEQWQSNDAAKAEL